MHVNPYILNLNALYAIHAAKKIYRMTIEYKNCRMKLFTCCTLCYPAKHFKNLQNEMEIWELLNEVVHLLY